ncbi:arabinofuranosidase catalytic domain-containing protein [Streptomyces malaysiensis]|uniref:arabinofuranosidase catalytic domain-containing protein n=1 Tax=Streptomyces malaysiensis TaxID=92644 RepID=UPI0036A799E0
MPLIRCPFQEETVQSSLVSVPGGVSRGRRSPTALATGSALMLIAVLVAVFGRPVPASAAGTGPCDIYASGGTPCVAAHSTVRALFGSYAGKLYQVRRSSDNATRDIGALTAGGVANAAAQDAFCAGTSCVITWVYDQSGHGNSLGYQGPGGVGGSDTAANATSESLTVGGNRAYSLYINPKNSYWRDGHTTGVPTGSAPEAMYMVTSGTHVNSGCCFDYGNSETTRKADGPGAMDAINFSTQCWFGGCSGNGPWVQADLEWGLFSGGSQSWNPNQRAFTSKFVTATLKNNGTSRFAIKGSNAQSGNLTTLYAGSLPSGYNPMKKQGAIILGSGGDCCNGNTNLSAGTFYEGAMVSGYPSDQTENAVQVNITTAGYR